MRLNAARGPGAGSSVTSVTRMAAADIRVEGFILSTRRAVCCEPEVGSGTRSVSCQCDLGLLSIQEAGTPKT